ncbi:MAG: hypothetical protein ABR497_12590 [Kiritimatiellia bacterium]
MKKKQKAVGQPAAPCLVTRQDASVKIAELARGIYRDRPFGGD